MIDSDAYWDLKKSILDERRQEVKAGADFCTVASATLRLLYFVNDPCDVRNERGGTFDERRADAIDCLRRLWAVRSRFQGVPE